MRILSLAFLLLSFGALILGPKLAVSTASMSPPQSPPPVVSNADIFWVEDAVPTGALYGGYWSWDTTQKSNGIQSHTAPAGPGLQRHYFFNANQQLTVNAGDKLVCFVRTDTDVKEVMLEFYDASQGWEHRAYWGAWDRTGFGAEYTASRYRMGDLPQPSQWIRLEIPAAAVGLEGKTISGMAFTSYDGQVWFDSARQEAYSPATFWVEDALPVGATPVGTWTWQSSSKVNGSLSHTEPLASGIHQHYFTNAAKKLEINSGDTLFCYVFIPSYTNEIMLQWLDTSGSWEHRAYWGSDWIPWGASGTASRYPMGALPTTGQWVKLEIPAVAVGLEGKAVSGMAFTLYGGQAYFDSVGKTPKPTGEVAWVEDNLPTGAVPAGNWNWDSTVKAGGLRSHLHAASSGIQQHYFTGATQSLSLTTGDKLFCYVFIDPAAPPREIMLQWYTPQSGWESRAYWGENLVGWGTNNTPSRRYMGGLPQAGQWARLEVPAAAVDLSGKTITGMAFTLHDGTVRFDSAGKAGRVTNDYWVDESAPGGAACYGTWNWDTGSKASGACSNTDPAAYGMHQHYFANATQQMTINAGDKLFCYVLMNVNNPPSEIMLQWAESMSWEHRAYWGSNIINAGANGTASRYPKGALPQAGQWVRLEIPAAEVGLEGKTVHGMAFTTYNGQAWFDNAGKTGVKANSCPVLSDTPPFTSGTVQVGSTTPPVDVTTAFSDPDFDCLKLTLTENTHPEFASVTLHKFANCFFGDGGFYEVSFTGLAEGTTYVTIEAQDADTSCPHAQWTFPVTVTVNHPPVVAHPIGTLILAPGVENQVRIPRDVTVGPATGIFLEPDNDPMLFTASSANPSIANVQMGSLAPGGTDTNALLITGLATCTTGAEQCTTTGTITADDQQGHVVPYTFNIIVDRAPVLDNAVGEVFLSDTRGITRFERHLNSPALFKDDDLGDSITYSLVSPTPDPNIATMFLGSTVSPPIPEDADLLQINFEGEGLTTATIRATDKAGVFSDHIIPIKAATGHAPVVAPINVAVKTTERKSLVLYDQLMPTPPAHQGLFTDPDSGDQLICFDVTVMPDTSIATLVTYQSGGIWWADVRGGINIGTTTAEITTEDSHNNRTSVRVTITVTAGEAPRAKLQISPVITGVGEVHPSWQPTELFEDPESGPMTFCMSTDSGCYGTTPQPDPNIASVELRTTTISPQVYVMEVTPVGAGCTQAAITATDNGGNSFIYVFDIYVNRPNGCSSASLDWKLRIPGGLQLLASLIFPQHNTSYFPAAREAAMSGGFRLRWKKDMQAATW